MTTRTRKSSDRYRGATLAEFEAWCKGAGRGGSAAGWHSSALAALDRFHKFCKMEEAKVQISEKLRQVED